ncbi:hypothetical protein POSPLADRAFT_1175105 [Postia placenta MAD-698-R-SB12]|uniref:Uncharacterized protein n=1 Tax=Postia placenta MAD-698-R-SB12 TaxID=670580 RepID=A0A1X6MKK0_9APHY|nr:hypothetical protein POSPLADRAFT_1175105 [Postia placenta MAD-698-R-SB12]OSX56712.1 hypothetical protein POSPLADRAFT_1175105 [Postia placenta MAD-698-R-SB12]
MFAKAIVVAFLALSLTASAAPAASSDCTVTVTARGVASSAALVSTGGKGKSTNNNTGAAASAASGSAASTSSNTGSLQSSLTLDSSLIQTGFNQNGQASGDPEGAGQVAANTSANNFINFCAEYANLPLTNGTQIKTGSCNAAPMGVIPATTAMPSAKFVFPANLATIPANQNFTIQMAIKNLETGNFVNPDTNYFAAPQVINAQGLIVGHSHVVIESIPSLETTEPTDPQTFQFFKGLNDVAVNGILSTTVAGGLPAGTYRMASINAAANHQPVLVAVAQHGTLDDMVYFTVSDNGAASSASGAAASGAAATGAAAGATASSAVSSAAASASAAAAGGNANKGGAAGAGAAAGKGAGAAAGKAGGAGKGAAGFAGKGKRWFGRA